MSAQHTPGPWFAEFEIWNGGSIIDAPGCFQIVDSSNRDEANVLCTRHSWKERADEMRANARLIAAAPRMKALLQEALMPDLSQPLRDHTEWLKDVRDLLEDEIGDMGGEAT